MPYALARAFEIAGRRHRFGQGRCDVASEVRAPRRRLPLANKAAPAGQACQAHERACVYHGRAAAEAVPVRFLRLFRFELASLTTAMMRSAICARLASLHSKLKPSPLISRPNRAHTRVPARRNRIPSMKSAESIKVSPSPWRMAPGSISERAGAERSPRCRFQ